MGQPALLNRPAGEAAQCSDFVNADEDVVRELTDESDELVVPHGASVVMGARSTSLIHLGAREDRFQRPAVEAEEAAEFGIDLGENGRHRFAAAIRFDELAAYCGCDLHGDVVPAVLVAQKSGAMFRRRNFEGSGFEPA